MEPKIKISLAIVAVITCLGFGLHYHSIDQQLLQISKEYQSYHLFRRLSDVKDTFNIKTISTDSMHSYEFDWTVVDCRGVSNDDLVVPISYDALNDSLHFSKPDSSKSPHGDKLYKLYVKDWEAYQSRQNPQPNGQVLVKEVWNVIQVMDNHPSRIQVPVKQSKNDLMLYTPTTRSKLF